MKGEESSFLTPYYKWSAGHHTHYCTPLAVGLRHTSTRFCSLNQPELFSCHSNEGGSLDFTAERIFGVSQDDTQLGFIKKTSLLEENEGLGSEIMHTGLQVCGPLTGESPCSVLVVATNTISSYILKHH